MTSPPGSPAPYPFLELLQVKMEERLAHKVPVQGRFCGNCFGRMRDVDNRCTFCGEDVETAEAVEEIPQEVLRAYRAKQRTEATWVYGFGFIGLIIASALFVIMVVWGPGLLGHPALAFAVLIGGGYVLARATGEILGGQIGYRRGVRKRQELWEAFEASRRRPGGA